jgi:hypothetical protein
VILELHPGKLLTIEEMPLIQDLDIPEAIYLVTREPALLAGMRRPSTATPWKELHRIGLRQIVCLTMNPPDYLAEPLLIVGHFPMQDLFGGTRPDDEEKENDQLTKAVNRVFSLVTRQIGVVVHCDGGTGRTGIVIGCVMKRLGYNVSEILTYLDSLNRERGAHAGWPESLWQAEMLQNYSEIRENRG